MRLNDPFDQKKEILDVAQETSSKRILMMEHKCEFIFASV
jgi:hypothetical protein